MKNLTLGLMLALLSLQASAWPHITEIKKDLLCFFDERGDEGFAIDHVSDVDVRFVEAPYVKYSLANCSKKTEATDRLEIKCQWPQNGEPVALQIDLQSGKGIAQLQSRAEGLKNLPFTCR